MIRFNDLDIRARTILIAVLPTMVMALVLIAYFTSSRLSDLEEVHSQRGKALARQLAAASEYGVFSGNRESLRKLSNTIVIERDVVRVAVIGPGGDILAESKTSDPPPKNTSPLRFREPVAGLGVNIEDPFLENSDAAPPPMGNAAKCSSK